MSNNVINGAASEYEMPSAMPGASTETSRSITISNTIPSKDNGDRICNTCNKSDVCMYKGELAQAAKEITQISECVNVFIDTDIRCKKWSGKVSNYRNI